MNSPTTPLDPVADADPRHIADPTAPPEWLLLVVRSVEDGRYLLVRRPENRVLTMLSTAPPHRTEGFAAGIASLVRTHLGVTLRGTPRVSTVRRPVHTVHPYTGGQRAGYLRALAVEVAGDPKVDALFDGLEALRLPDAVESLATDLERLLLQDGARLLSDSVPAGWTPSVVAPRPVTPTVVDAASDDAGDARDDFEDDAGDDEIGDDGEPVVALIDDEPELLDDSGDDAGELDDLDDLEWVEMDIETGDDDEAEDEGDER